MRAFILVALAACGAPPSAPVDGTPTLVRARDLDPDPRVVHVELFAKPGTHAYLPGKEAAIWGYADGPDGEPTVPGPMIEANVGDEIIVGLTNQLDTGTTIHWHGLRLPNGADGSTSTQDPILPGARYEARFTAIDAGTFWYHPHVKADEQIERGLHGAFIVHEASAPDVDADRMFVLDDVKLMGNGQLSDVTDQLDLMLGRQGNVVLVNGLPHAALHVAPGAIERWRFVNVANGRYFSLRGPAFRVVSWDGGALDEAYDAETLLIAPGERYDVLVTPEGGTSLITEHYDRGHDIPDPGPIALIDLVSSGAPLPARALPSLVAAPFTSLGTSALTPVKAFVLKEVEDESGLRFMINDEVWPFNEHVHVEQGDTEIWEIDNASEMDHPFHVHGMFFEVLSSNGAPPAHRGWKDTVNVPKMSKVRFAIRYDTVGMWMFHCHILEHAERGMMGDLMVVARQ